MLYIILTAMYILGLFALNNMYFVCSDAFKLMSHLTLARRLSAQSATLPLPWPGVLRPY